MPPPDLLSAIDEVLKAIRKKQSLDDVLHLILAKACHLASAAHGSFALVNHETKRLALSNVYGSDWTMKKRLCQLEFGQGLTGKAAVSAQPILCRDTREDADYFPLFSYVRSELVVPVLVKDRVWGVINIDGATADAFDQGTLDLLVVFAELASSAITLQLEISDQEKLYRKLVQSEKLASLGEALAGIAHEINNPLTSILGFSSLLAVTPGLDDSGQRSAAIISSEAQRAAALIRGLLDFSRKETGARELTDAHALVQKAAGLKRFQLRQGNVKLLVGRPDDPCPIYVCTQQMTQVLHNLITNAEQAVPKGRSGLIRITIERQPRVVRILVADNGTGIPDEARDRVFDPFFTTKAPGEGTGLGLSICHTIVTAHEGSIHVSESSSAGTTFALELPLADPEAYKISPAVSARAGENARTCGNQLAGVRILVVDDEPHIAGALTEFLGQRGASVITCGNAQSALTLLDTEKFDLIVSDVRMPMIDGLEFYDAAQLRHAHYKRRFVFMSGYLLQPRVRAHLNATGLPCLEKPFSLDELERVLVRQLHDS